MDNLHEAKNALLVQARLLAGKTLSMLAEEYALSIPPHLNQNKGWIGQLLERALSASSGNLPQPDFPHLGIELKSLPINKIGLPKESTYVCCLTEHDLACASFHESLVYQKLKCVLWVPIQSDPAIPLAERRIGMPLLWQPSQPIMQQLEDDFWELIELLLTGKRESITARQGYFLQLRPKGADSKSVEWVMSSTGESVPSMRLGFYLRTKLTASIVKQSYCMTKG